MEKDNNLLDVTCKVNLANFDTELKIQEDDRLNSQMNELIAKTSNILIEGEIPELITLPIFILSTYKEREEEEEITCFIPDLKSIERYLKLLKKNFRFKH